MVCIYVNGANYAVRTAAAGGQLELNVFMPVISYELITSLEYLSNAVETFTKKCVSGLKANEYKISKTLEMDLSLATSLNQYIGYAKAAEIANIARKQGKSIKQVCIEKKILDKRTLDIVLNPKKEA
jgi:fumarate hydratase class II